MDGQTTHQTTQQQVKNQSVERTTKKLDMNACLPFEVPTDEAEAMLGRIKTNLALDIASGNYAPGAVFWTRQLNSYLELKYPLPLDDRLVFIRLYHGLIFLPNMDFALIETWANTCARLLKKKELIGDDMLTFDWRPFYVLIKKVHFSQQRQRGNISDMHHVSAVVKLVDHVRRFFPPETTMEVLEEFLPSIYLNSTTPTLTNTAFLSTFLPTNIRENVDAKLSLSPEQTTLHPQLFWVSHLFRLWTALKHLKSFDIFFLDIFSRLAHDQYGRNTVFFTDDQIKFIFSLALHNLNLPVGSSGTAAHGALSKQSPRISGLAKSNDEQAMNGILMRYKSEPWELFATFVIYTICPSSLVQAGFSTSLRHFQTFIKGVEGFYYPSNSGRWTQMLIEMTNEFATKLLYRVEQEKTGKAKYSCEYFLGSIDQQTLVVELRDKLFISMYGSETMDTSNLALRDLAWLEPELIFPELLEKAFVNFENITQTQRISSTLNALANVVVPLFHRVHYPPGAVYLLQLMELALPGIDMNDLKKTTSTLGFYMQIFMGIPLIESSFGVCLKPLSESTKYSSEQIKEFDSICRTSTTGFESFVLAFLDRVFVMFSNIPQLEAQSHGKNMESNVLQVLLMTCSMLFAQLSPEIYSLCLGRLVSYVKQSVIPNACEPVAQLCGEIVFASPKKSLEILLPLCIQNIQVELEHGAGSKISQLDDDRSSSAPQQPHSSDSSLLWYLTILSECVSAGRESLVLFQDEIVRITKLAWSKCQSRPVYNEVAGIVSNIISSMADIYVTDYRSAPNWEWENKEILWRDIHHRFWCVPTSERSWWTSEDGSRKAHDLEGLSWHVPSEQEKDSALAVFKAFIEPEIEKLASFMNEIRGRASAKSEIERINLCCKSLVMIGSCLKGSAMFCGYEKLQKSADSPALFDDDEGQSKRERFPVEASYCFQNPNDIRYKYMMDLQNRLGLFLHEFLCFLQNHREDDVESTKLALNIVRLYLIDKGIDKKDYLSRVYSYRRLKKLMKFSRGAQTKFCPRLVTMRRVNLQYLVRLRYNATNIPMTPSLEKRVAPLLEDLKNLSLGFYSGIRTYAQDILMSCLKCYTSFKYKLLPKILDYLDTLLDEYFEFQKKDTRDDSYVTKESEYHKKMKGALFLLQSKPFFNSCIRDWKYVSRFMLLLCKVQLVDKPSIQDLLRNLFVDYLVNFSPISFELPPSDSLQPLLLYLSPETSSQNINVKLKEKRANGRHAWCDLVQALTAEAKKAPTDYWRSTLLIMNFFDMQLRADMPIPLEIMKYAWNCTTHEVQAVRKVSLGLLGKLFTVLKERTLKSKKTYVKTADCLPSNQSVQQFIEKCYELIQTKEEWERSVFIDRHYYGWSSWPKDFKCYVYNGTTASTLFFTEDTDSSAALDEMTSRISSGSFWQTLLKYLGQESSPLLSSTRGGGGAPDEQFSSVTARIFKSLFQMYEDQFLYAHLAPTLEVWCKSNEKNHQRAAAEILSGLLRGCKHWPFDKLQRMWLWLIPILKQTFLMTTPETLVFWSQFITFSLSNRDPKRYLPLFRLATEDSDLKFNPKAETSFGEAKKLFLSRSIVALFQWRLRSDCVTSMFQQAFDHFDHQYKQVREILAGNFYDFMLYSSCVPSMSAGIYNGGKPIGAILKELQKQSRNDSIQLLTFPLIDQKDDAKSSLFAQRLLDSLSTSKQQLRAASEDTNATAVIGTEYANVCKSILRLMIECSTSTRSYFILPLLLTCPYANSNRCLLVALFEMLTTDDQDITESAHAALSSISEIYYTLSTDAIWVSSFLDTFEHAVIPMSHDNVTVGWKVRMKVLAMLQIFYFRHLMDVASPSNNEAGTFRRVVELVSGLLRDSHVEVRQMAGITLGGVIRCTLNSDDPFLGSLLDRFSKLVKNDSSTSSSEKMKRDTLLLDRHAGVLGMSALISAFPYDIPTWLPDTLVLLSRHIHESGCVSTTIKSTFADFRRTHQDTWHEDVTSTTSSSQLEALYGYADFTRSLSNSPKKMPKHRENQSANSRVTKRAKGHFTADHLYALEGLLTSSASYYA